MQFPWLCATGGHGIWGLCLRHPPPKKTRKKKQNEGRKDNGTVWLSFCFPLKTTQKGGSLKQTRHLYFVPGVFIQVWHCQSCAWLQPLSVGLLPTRTRISLPRCQVDQSVWYAGTRVFLVGRCAGTGFFSEGLWAPVLFFLFKVCGHPFFLVGRFAGTGFFSEGLRAPVFLFVEGPRAPLFFAEGSRAPDFC